MIFYLTMGVQYATVGHPTLSNREAHPDGYIAVEAPSYEAARQAVIARCGRAWASLYDETQFDPSYHPRGEVARIVAQT